MTDNLSIAVHDFASRVFMLFLQQYIYGEMVDFGESDKMVKISGKVDKLNVYNGFSSNILLFILKELLQTKHSFFSFSTF